MAEVVTQSSVANWTKLEEATEQIKKLATDVKAEAESTLNTKFEKFEATQFRSGTPGGSGMLMYAVKVDIGGGDEKFVHLMISSQVVQNPTSKLERCALFFHKNSPLEAF